MPTYRNATALDITVGAYRFPAYSDLAIDNFVVLPLPAGLTLVSALPLFKANLTLLSNVYTAKSGADIAAITVPDSPSNSYTINFYVESGEFLIRFNDDSMTPPLRVTEGEVWRRTYTSRVVNDIRIHCVTGGAIYVDVFQE